MEGLGNLATEARGGLLRLGEINSMRHPEHRDTNEPRPDPAGFQWTRIRYQTIRRESTQQLCTEMSSFARYRENIPAMLEKPAELSWLHWHLIEAMERDE